LVKYVRIRVSRAISPSGLPDLDYALNPYVGCAHACIYCYARAYTRYKEVSRRWGEVVYIKENLLSILSKELRRYRPGKVGVSTITDAYQPIEAEEKITRRAIKMLVEHGFRVSIQTKSTLVLRDLDIISSKPAFFDVGFTITTMNDEKARIIEPHSPPPSERAEALRAIASRNIATWVFLGPIIPLFNDTVDDIAEIVELAATTGSLLYYDYLRYKPGLEDSLKAPIESSLWIIDTLTPSLYRLTMASDALRSVSP